MEERRNQKNPAGFETVEAIPTRNPTGSGPCGLSSPTSIQSEEKLRRVQCSMPFNLRGGLDCLLDCVGVSTLMRFEYF